MKILIVEDNAEMRQLLKSMLRGPDTHFIECADGAGALAAFEQHQPDWVLMDLGLGKVDGLTATRRIVAAHPAGRVVIVTGQKSPQLQDAARAAGATGFVLKDNLHQLQQVITSRPQT
jgi:CheY-like chemotaxis protein